MGHLEKIGIPFLATRVLKISEATLLRETVVRVVLKILQHLSNSTNIFKVVLSLNVRSLDSP